MKRTVYLAGLISTDFPESLSWRKRAEGELMTLFDVRTPLVGKVNLKEESPDGGISSTTATARDIVLRDYRDVREADVILAHLETFGSPRPLVGTVAELAWAWQLNKPVVAIASPDNYLMRNHPFVSEFIAHYWETEAEAYDFLRRYYGGLKP